MQIDQESEEYFLLRSRMKLKWRGCAMTRARLFNRCVIINKESDAIINMDTLITKHFSPYLITLSIIETRFNPYES